MNLPPDPADAFSDPLDKLKINFFEAAAVGDTDLMEDILKSHPNAAMWEKPVAPGDMPFATRVTPLMEAAEKGEAEAVRLLLAHGAQVNAQNSRGWTALMHAAWQGKGEAVDALLWRLPDTRLESETGATASSLALTRDHREIAHMINNALEIYGLKTFKTGTGKTIPAPRVATFGNK